MLSLCCLCVWLRTPTPPFDLVLPGPSLSHLLFLYIVLGFFTLNLQNASDRWLAETVLRRDVYWQINSKETTVHHRLWDSKRHASAAGWGGKKHLSRTIQSNAYQLSKLGTTFFYEYFKTGPAGLMGYPGEILMYNYYKNNNRTNTSFHLSYSSCVR